MGRTSLADTARSDPSEPELAEPELAEPELVESELLEPEPAEARDSSSARRRSNRTRLGNPGTGSRFTMLLSTRNCSSSPVRTRFSCSRRLSNSRALCTHPVSATSRSFPTDEVNRTMTSGLKVASAHPRRPISPCALKNPAAAPPRAATGLRQRVFGGLHWPGTNDLAGWLGFEDSRLAREGIHAVAGLGGGLLDHEKLGKAGNQEYTGLLELLVADGAQRLQHRLDILAGQLVG